MGVTAVLNHDEMLETVTRHKEPKKIVEYSLREIGKTTPAVPRRPEHDRCENMTMLEKGNAVKTIIRKFKIADLDQILAMVERYASWDATPTKADIEGFHSASPEFFFVAEAKEKVIGFV